MENKPLIITLAIGVAVIILGMFGFAYLNRSDETLETPLIQSENENPEIAPYNNIDRIDAKHFFRDGVHTLVGEIAMPTPCDLLTWDARVMESFPEQVIIDFKVINTADTCVQVVTPQRFKAEFSASEEAVVRATFLGRTIELNLIPAEAGESPDDFELFIKG